MKIFIVLITLISGCASDPALDFIETTSAKLQPGYDALKVVCPAVMKCSDGDESSEKINEACLTVDRAFKDAQTVLEAATIAFGGEPCLENCSTSSTE